MSAFARKELEEMIQRFVAANNQAGETGDWSIMPQFYTEDAVYSWNNGDKYEFVARGLQQIREWAYGTEMDGLQKWTYPYVRTLIDDQRGEVVGFWRQVAPSAGPNGEPYEIGGTGGSWFRYAGGGKWGWQRDFFDHGNAGIVFMRMLEAGRLSEKMQQRLKAGSRMPGWVKRPTFDWYGTVADREDD